MVGKKKEMTYTVKQLAALAGVTVRTLHLYDKIGLLKPSMRTEKRYRLYSERELLLLQQILFYRELDLPLKEIAGILDDPTFDLIKSLEGHKAVMKNRKKQITEILFTIDKTILKLKGKITMKHEELYKGLPKEKTDEWRKFAKEKWPKQVEHAENSLLNMEKEGFRQLKDGFNENWKNLFGLRFNPPESRDVQLEVGKHYHFIQLFWGRTDNIGEAYKCLGQLFLDEPSYTAINDIPDKEFAQFMYNAMHYFVDSNNL